MHGVQSSPVIMQSLFCYDQCQSCVYRKYLISLVNLPFTPNRYYYENKQYASASLSVTYIGPISKNSFIFQGVRQWHLAQLNIARSKTRWTYETLMRQCVLFISVFVYFLFRFFRIRLHPVNENQCNKNYNIMQSNAVITLSNIVRYCIDNWGNWGRISIRCRTHKKHTISRPYERDM